MKYLGMTLFSILLLTSACNNNHSSVSQVTALPKDDQGFLALKDTAQTHLNIFIDSLKKYAKDSNYRFLIKSDFYDGTNHEHMWSEITDYKANGFKAMFADSAYMVKNIKQGDTLTIKRKDVEDWTIFDNKSKKRYGFYSEGYLKSRQ